MRTRHQKHGKPLTIKFLLDKLPTSSKDTLKEYFTTGIWSDAIDKIRLSGFFITLGVAAKNEGINGSGLSKELKEAVLAQL